MTETAPTLAPTAASAPAPTPGALLSAAALGSFRANGLFLEAAEQLSRPIGLTAARWQVLGAVLVEPLTVAGIARSMGITRQSVQRLADLLVEQGLAEYLPNPAHRRAKLVQATEQGRAAVHAIGPAHAELARKLVERLGGQRLAEAVAALDALSGAMTEILDSEQPATD
ncbi:MarR family winged helix-turn-helix transcriptional regulator [Streptacidiphilus carbonis]|jgi:DNA-binding MarR family transcriptional regulator|uniref:MarR family winged helix-turn-helix transcriptional regulator n=1 Tax=Streptacidiphilus carbonis TaxID=105422 RepID=UPI0006940EEB|nr:MarR family transcriptional regulator [Streptacidiphilus carbonis]